MCLPADIDDVILSSQAVRYLMYAIIAAGMVLLGYVLSEVTRDNQTASSQIEKVGAALQPVGDAQPVKNERVVAATPIAKQPLGLMILSSRMRGTRSTRCSLSLRAICYVPFETSIQETNGLPFC